MNHEVYIAAEKICRIYQKDIFLGNVADVVSDNPLLAAKCRALKLFTIQGEKDIRYVLHMTDIIKKIQELEKNVTVNSLGETDFIVSYQKKRKYAKIRSAVKIIFTCLICFFGAAFAIMTFNADVSVAEILKEIYLFITGMESDGFTILEISYSIGLAIGILGFFNHISLLGFSRDPTPLEVEMRLYEENVCKTEIINEARKETEVDAF